MSDDDNKNDKPTPAKKKRKPPEKRPMKTRPSGKKKSAAPSTDAAEQQASADLGKVLTPDALKTMFVDALHKSGLGKQDNTATPEQLATALPEMLKNVTANLGEQMRDALLPQLAQLQNLSAEDLEKLRQALAEQKQSEEKQGEGEEKERSGDTAPPLSAAPTSPPGGGEEESGDVSAPPSAHQGGGAAEGGGGGGPELGNKVRQAIDEYVAANASTVDAEGNPTAHVDGEFLRAHAGQMLGNALGALLKAFVPAAEQLGQRIAESATPPREGQAKKTDAEADAPGTDEPKKKVNYEIDFAGLVGSVLSGMRKTQSQRRRPRKVEPAPEPPTDVTGEPHGDAAEIVEAVGEAEERATEPTTEKKPSAAKKKAPAKKRKPKTSNDDDGATS